jgi:hypothetical protein
MSYQEWIKNRDSSEQHVEDLVRLTEVIAQVSGTEVSTAKSEVLVKFDWLPFSPRVWQVYFANTLALAGVKRIDKRPYATHPTRMALSCYWLAPRDLAEDSAVPALLHDYLEESGGISAASIAALKNILPHESLAVPAAVYLSEPDIAYNTLGSEEEESKLKRVAYLIQASDALKKGYPPALVNASIVDKLDNLHDLGYLNNVSDLEKRLRKIAQRIAFFQQTLEHIGPFASASFQTMLKTAIVARTQEFGVEKLLQEELSSLTEHTDRSKETIKNMVGAFHKRIGLS